MCTSHKRTHPLAKEMHHKLQWEMGSLFGQSPSIRLFIRYIQKF